MERFSGLKLNNRVVSSAEMDEEMKNRRMIKINELQKWSKNQEANEKVVDWVIIGVVQSNADKRSSKGSMYSLWTLTDLMGETAGLLLYGNASQEHNEMKAGSVVAVLSPDVVPSSDNSRAMLKVFKAQAVVKLGMIIATFDIIASRRLCRLCLLQGHRPKWHSMQDCCQQVQGTRWRQH